MSQRMFQYKILNGQTIIEKGYIFDQNVSDASQKLLQNEDWNIILIPIENPEFTLNTILDKDIKELRKKFIQTQFKKGLTF